MELNYTKDDFVKGTAPFEWVEAASTPFEKEQRKTEMQEYAKSVGVKNFITLYKLYVKTLKMMESTDYVENACTFSDQPIELNTGSWSADDYGISREGVYGEEVACTHPIIPTLRLVNVDSGLEKIELAYRPGKVWKKTIFDRKTISSRSLIIELSSYGILVDTENSKYLVKYLTEVISRNYTKIPEHKSVSRLGWVGDEGFSPYVKGLVFDGEESYKAFFESVTSHGSEEAWLNLAKEIRADSNPVPKILLAASFASVLIEKLGGLPFFVHLWGGTEAGKSVGLMLASSVWANPEIGKYIHTFNSTAVAQELSASFVNSLPLCLDELQILKDKKDFDAMIYQLAEGVGKGRGEKTGGLKKVGTWRNCILTTGEQPITSSASGGGAMNRILEVDCADMKLFRDPRNVADTVRANYGFAGRRFVECLTPEVLESAKGYYKEISETFNTLFADDSQNATEKQSMAASMIIVADFIATKYIFKDKNQVTMADLHPYLATKSDVDQNQRAFEWLSNWVGMNQSKFVDAYSENFVPSELYGRFNHTDVAIVQTVFDTACRDAGFNPSSFQTWLNRTGRTETDKHRKNKKVRLTSVASTRCVYLPKFLKDD